MTPKPVVPRALANRDGDEAVDHYLRAGEQRAGFGFVDALERAYRHIARRPATGSLRCAHALELPGLRCWPLKRFPHLVFYVERDDHIDVWRILHGQRDVPAWMQEPAKPR